MLAQIGVVIAIFVTSLHIVVSCNLVLSLT